MGWDLVIVTTLRPFLSLEGFGNSRKSRVPATRQATTNRPAANEENQNVPAVVFCQPFCPLAIRCAVRVGSCANCRTVQLKNVFISKQHG